MEEHMQTCSPRVGDDRRRELAGFVGRAAEGPDGSLAFLTSEQARDVASLLESGCAGAWHMALPAASDGLPIKVGERVWVAGESEQLRVEAVNAFGAALGDLIDPESTPRFVLSGEITHTRPDSWARIADDLRGGPGAYFLGGDCGGSCTGCTGPAVNVPDCWRLMAEKLADRIEALAGGAR